MKHYELEYDNKWQKLLWGLEMAIPCICCPIICIFLLFIILSLSDDSPTAVSIILIALSFVAGVALSIYNFCKLKGVFVFDDYIEIVIHHIINRKINFKDIYKLERCEKYYYFYYVESYFWNPSAGGRRNCIIVRTLNTVACIKVKNQQELLKTLRERSNKKFQ